MAYKTKDLKGAQNNIKSKGNGMSFHKTLYQVSIHILLIMI